MHRDIHVLEHPHLVAMTTDEGLKLQQHADADVLPQCQLTVDTGRQLCDQRRRRRRQLTSHLSSGYNYDSTQIQLRWLHTVAARGFLPPRERSIQPATPILSALNKLKININ